MTMLGTIKYLEELESQIMIDQEINKQKNP
jgi:hypothetical protein